MHADLLTQHVFRDLLRQQRPVLYLFRQQTNATGNISDRRNWLQYSALSRYCLRLALPLCGSAPAGAH